MRAVTSSIRIRSLGLSALLAGLLVVSAAPLCADGAAHPDAASILRKAERVRSPELDYAVDFRLDVTDPNSSWKKRHAVYTMIAHGKNHSLVLMREPKQFHPGTLLISNGMYWLLLPRSDKAFQLAPRHVLNGDISNGDLARGNLLNFYEPRYDGREEVDGVPCYRLDLERKVNLGLYAGIRAWIAVDTFRPVKFEYYGHTGDLLKTALYEDYTDGEIGVRPMKIVVDNAVRPGERSVLTFSNLRRFESSRFTYSREALPAFRDAAFAKLRADGVQAQPEDLIELLGLEEP